MFHGTEQTHRVRTTCATKVSARAIKLETNGKDAPSNAIRHTSWAISSPSSTSGRPTELMIPVSLSERPSLSSELTDDLSPAVSDELFLSKYTESSGNAREFVWKGLLSNFDPR